MTETKVLIEALRILARDIQSGDGVANAAIAEAADRLEKQQESASDCSLLKDLANRVRDWYSLRGVPIDDASVLRMCVEDVQADHAIYLRLAGPVIDLVRAVESVQDWSGTIVGDKIAVVEEVLKQHY